MNPMISALILRLERVSFPDRSGMHAQLMGESGWCILRSCPRHITQNTSQANHNGMYAQLMVSPGLHITQLQTPHYAKYVKADHDIIQTKVMGQSGWCTVPSCTHIWQGKRHR
jgi:hypothetical protein